MTLDVIITPKQRRVYKLVANEGCMYKELYILCAFLINHNTNLKIDKRSLNKHLKIRFIRFYFQNVR